MRIKWTAVIGCSVFIFRFSVSWNFSAPKSLESFVFGKMKIFFVSARFSARFFHLSASRILWRERAYRRKKSGLCTVETALQFWTRRIGSGIFTTLSGFGFKIDLLQKADFWTTWVGNSMSHSSLSKILFAVVFIIR